MSEHVNPDPAARSRRRQSLPPAPAARINRSCALAVEKRVTMTMVVFGILVLGVLSLLRLPLEFMPSFQNSNVSVYAPYNSSSPEEVARLIVRPLEDALSTINGVKRLSARASANDASIDLEFNEGVDMDLAAVEVRDRVDRVRNDLPNDLERVFIRRFQSSDIPVLRMNLSAAWEGERLFEFIEDVMRRRLERLEGVANVEVWGLLTPQLRVDLLPQRMAAHGVDVRTVILALQNGNVSLAGGYVREGSRKLLVRVMGELDSVDQIKRLPLGKRRHPHRGRRRRGVRPARALRVQLAERRAVGGDGDQQGLERQPAGGGRGGEEGARRRSSGCPKPKGSRSRCRGTPRTTSRRA